jgi:hypothetical protein
MQLNFLLEVQSNDLYGQLLTGQQVIGHSQANAYNGRVQE